MELQVQGEIASWNDDKGYGFITPLSGGKRIFVHIKSFKNRSQRPQPNQQVSYSVSKDQRGRICADNVTYSGKRSGAMKQTRSTISALIIGGVFLGILGVAERIINRSFLLVSFCFVMSLVAYFLYAVDKTAAQKGRWRIAEAHLHLLALIGGWPGAMVAQQKLRHKTKKQEFRFIFWITVILNCAAAIWLLTPQGTFILDSLIKEILKNMG